jgi:hypothetical protein
LTVDLAPREQETVQVDIPFVTVQFSSIPSAQVEWRPPNRPAELLGQTPFQAVLPEDGYYFVFTNAGYLNKSIWAELSETTNVTANLEVQSVGEFTLDLQSDVDRRFARSVFLLDDRETDRFISFKPHRQYRLKVLPPMPWPALETNILLPGYNTNFTYSPPHGSVQLDYRDPALSKADVWFAGAGDQEGKLGKVGEELFRLPPGTHQLTFELPGYESSSAVVEIKPGATNLVPVRLDPPAASLILTASLHGAKVFTNGLPAGEAGPEPGEPLRLRSNMEHLVEVGFSNAMGRLPSEKMRIKLGPAEQLQTNVTLRYGIVLFDVTPPGAIIQNAGVPLSARVAVQAPGETVSYEISAPGYRTITSPVVLTNGETKSLEIQLMKD